MGSGSFTRGGGSIQLNCDTAVIYGLISADADPGNYSGAGGSVSLFFVSFYFIFFYRHKINIRTSMLSVKPAALFSALGEDPVTQTSADGRIAIQYEVLDNSEVNVPPLFFFFF